MVRQAAGSRQPFRFLHIRRLAALGDERAPNSCTLAAISTRFDVLRKAERRSLTPPFYEITPLFIAPRAGKGCAHKGAGMLQWEERMFWLAAVRSCIYRGTGS